MKTTLLALCIAVAFLIAVLFVRDLNHTKAVESRFVFDTTQAGSIVSLSVRLGEDSATLIKHDGRWLVLPDSFPADTARVGLALRHLLRLEDKEIVSMSSDSTRLMDFGLNASEVKRVSWTAAGKSEMIHLGQTSGIDFSSTYWKRPDRTEVYRTPGNFTHEIGAHPREWKDKTLFPPFEAGDVVSISVRWRDEGGGVIAYALTARVDSAYRLTVPGRTDSVVIPPVRGRDLFGAASRLAIDDVPDADDPYRMLAVTDSPTVALTIGLRNGAVHDLTVGLETDEHAYFRHPSHHGIVKMFKSRLEQFRKTPAQLLETEASNASAAGAWEDVTMPGGPE